MTTRRKAIKLLASLSLPIHRLDANKDEISHLYVLIRVMEGHLAIYPFYSTAKKANSLPPHEIAFRLGVVIEDQTYLGVRQVDEYPIPNFMEASY